MNAKPLALALGLALVTPAHPQGAGGQGLAAEGFAGLGADAQGFALPDPAYRLSFPRDHGAHPAFRIEWWYLTASLTGPDGAEYGAQWTLFRSALAPSEAEGWDSPQLWMAHAAVTGASFHHHAERFARGGIGQAGVIATPFTAWIDDWQMTGQTAPPATPPADALDRITITARGSAFAFDLDAEAQGPLVLHGDQGFSVKSATGTASHYYSQPFYTVTGTLYLTDTEVPVTGTAWLDREWSSQPLEGAQTGWDWFALAFDDGSRLMAAQLRDGAGGYRIGTHIAPDGTATPLAPDDLRLTPLTQTRVEGRDIPTRWRVEYPAASIDVTAEAVNPQAWMGTSFAYWEGPLRLSGSHAGRGYLEMTGY